MVVSGVGKCACEQGVSEVQVLVGEIGYGKNKQKRAAAATLMSALYDTNLSSSSKYLELRME